MALSGYFARELSLPVNMFWSFFSAYTIGGTLLLAVGLPLLPRKLADALPEFVFRVGFVRRAPRTSAAKPGGGDR